MGARRGRQDQPLVIAVGHDDGANEAGGKTPGGCPAVLQLVVLIQVLDIEGFGKILAQECGMCRTAELWYRPSWLRWSRS